MNSPSSVNSGSERVHVHDVRARRDRSEMRALIEQYSYKADTLDEEFLGGGISDSNDVEEMVGLTDSSSLWKKSKKFVEVRPRGWLNRFAGQLDESCIKAEKTNPRWLGLIPKHHRKGAKPQLDPILRDPPVVPEQYDESRLPKFKDSSRRTNLCYLCWGAVPVGERTCCLSCPVISHHRCVVDIKRYLVSQRYTATTTTSSQCPSSPRLAINKSHSNVEKVADPLAEAIVEETEAETKAEAEAEAKGSTTKTAWQCPFCLETIQRRNQHANLKYLGLRHKYEQAKAAIRLQSFFRMVARRAKYLKGRLVALTLQRRLRSKMFWKRKQREENRKKRPFRLQIHSLKAFIHYSCRGLDHYEEFPELPKDMGPIKVGEIVAHLYDQFVSGNDEEEEVKVEEKSETVCHFLAKEKPPFPPTYLKTYNLIKPIPKGSFICTVTILCNSSGSGGDTSRQIGRIDFPVVMAKGAYLQRITPEMLPDLGISIDPNDTENYSLSRNNRLCEEFRIATLTPIKSNLIMIPACNSFCTIKITLSQISKYPKTLFVGQCEQNINPFLMWKKSASWYHPLSSNVDSVDFPQADTDSRIDVRERVQSKATKKVPHYCKPTLHISGMDEEDVWAGGYEDKNDDDDEDHPRLDSRDSAFGGLVHWSLRAVSFEGLDEAGDIYFCSTGQVSTSDKRKCWAVIIDSILHIFGNLTANIDFRSKEEHNLKTCSVSWGFDGMIKVRSSSLIFLLGTSPKATANWYKKLYINSHSHVHKQFDEKWLLKPPNQ